MAMYPEGTFNQYRKRHSSYILIKKVGEYIQEPVQSEIGSFKITY